MTNSFYTSVYRMGNKLLVRGYNNEKPFSRKVDFTPTLYIDAKKPTSAPSEWKILDGTTVYPINPGTMRDCKDFIDSYKDVHGFNVHGINQYEYQYISETYPEDLSPDVSKIKIVSIDIETTAEYGFPNIEQANEEILLITLKDKSSKKFITFGIKPFENTEGGVYRYSKDEPSMLKDFMNFWQQNYPDVVTGWNINFFDTPYLVRRMTRLLGADFANKLSPWGIVNERRIHVKGNEEIAYDIAGISFLDYLDLYKKYTYTTQESYRLDHIAYVELGEGKLENPYENFVDFYTKAWDTFVKYNIRDTELVDRLEDKMRLIETHLTLAYTAKINYDDVFSPVKMWDMIIYNHLLKRKIVIQHKSSSGKSEKFEGAYVKDPLIGQHKWVASFDLNSLYPHLIMQYNISPETLVEDFYTTGNVDKFLNKEVDTSEAKSLNYTVTANGWSYRTDIKGFLPELMDKMYSDRSMYKKQMLKCQQDYEHTKDEEIQKEISRLTNLQMALKIALNSLYGAVGNAYFRYFDIRMAEGITTSGQLSIRWMANKLNDLMNKTLKTVDKDYVIAIDTDSIYLSLELLVETTCAGKTTEQKISYMDKVCEQVFQPFIDKGYQELATYMNAYAQKMIMKREVLADKGIWVAKKNYVLNVHNSEGVQYTEPKLKILGLSMVRSSTPEKVRAKLKESLQVILHGSQQDLHKFVDDFRSDFYKMPVDEIARPSGMNGMNDYRGSPIYKIKTPIHVRGALLYNHHIKRIGLDKKYPAIRDGDKVKYVYVKKPNPFHEDVIAFSGTLPTELGLDNFIDYDKQFEKVFLDGLKTVIEPLGWTPEVEQTLEEFFG
jgi:DNA polymerase elongation subunit (family B)